MRFADDVRLHPQKNSSNTCYANSREREREREMFVGCTHSKKHPCAFRAEPTHANLSQRNWKELENKIKNACTKIYKFCESLHRFLGRPSLLVVFVRNHGVHSRIRAGQRSHCIVRTLCTISCLRFRWRSHQSVSLYFAASSSLRQVALSVYSTQVSFGRRLTPTMSLSILLLLVRRSLSVSAHIVQHDDP